MDTRSTETVGCDSFPPTPVTNNAHTANTELHIPCTQSKQKKKKLNQTFSTPSCCKSADTLEQIKAKNPSVTSHYPRCAQSFFCSLAEPKAMPRHRPLCQWVPAISVPTHIPLSPSLARDHAGKHFGLHFPFTSQETAQLADTAVVFQLSLPQALIITYRHRQKAKCSVSPLLPIQLLHLPKRSLMSSRTALAEISW